MAGATRTDLSPVKVSLTLWREDWSGRDWRQGGSRGRLDQPEREKVVASARGGTGDREGWRRGKICWRLNGCSQGSDLALEGDRDGEV